MLPDWCISQNLYIGLRCMKHVAYRVIYGVCIDEVSQQVTDPQRQDVSEQARDQTTKKKQILV